jgi:hypothetical protein
MNLKILAGAAVAALSFAAASAASAGVIVLNFAGLGYQESVDNYYNGGTGGNGSGPGPNYGISFTSNGIACPGAPASPACNSAMIPGGPGAQLLFFLSGPAATMNVAAGFTTGFAFDYSAVNNPGVINVWSGLNDTGTLLATLALPTTPNGAGIPGCFGTNFCPYVPIDVAFAGTAMSVDFGGTENQIAFANVTLGSTTPGVPEPASWALMLVGFGGLGMALRSRRRPASATVA